MLEFVRLLTAMQTSDKNGIATLEGGQPDYAAIAGYGIAATPGVVVDDRVVHSGGLPKPDNIAKWLA